MFNWFLIRKSCFWFTIYQIKLLMMDNKQNAKNDDMI